MMRSLLCVFLSAGCLEAGTLTKYVNPFVGTGGHGHTYPGAAAPFGMVQLSPDTRVEGWDACAGYHYSDSTILGFSHTHLSGTGVADYGDILFMPASGDISMKDFGSHFSHRNESASPGFYSVLLDRYHIKAELTASTRLGLHRYTFPAGSHGNIIIDLHHGLGPDQVLESNLQILSDHEIAGSRRSNGWAKDQHVFFAAEFSRPFTSYGIAINDTLLPGVRSAAGTNIKGYVRFPNSSAMKVLVKVALSSVSIEGARRNLKDFSGWDFEKLRARTELAWENELSKIVVEGSSDKLKTFYTALYHVFLTPNVFSDLDGSYRGMDNKIYKADDFTMYTIFSLWDTFRAEHPLLTIIDRKRTLDFVKSLLAKYEQSGVLPVWELACNETWCMIGYHSVPVIADAFLKNITGFDAGEALDAMKHSATLDHYGLKEYRLRGYVPGENEPESVSKTLEYSYDDWCIARMAQALGKKSDADEYFRRSQFYRNLFDPSTGFMRPMVNASWDSPFDPTAVTNHYTEANPWQYSFFAPQDVDGLIDLMGGSQKFVTKLDSLFEANPALSGRQQADISGLIGQYAQGNEPSHHVAYLYDYAGAAWKSQHIVRRIMDSLFTPNPDGLCGNDDCGQMSAWYVMSSLGFYQVAPSLPVYAIGSPAFTRVSVRLENKKHFTVLADDNRGRNEFIQSATLNGSPYPSCFITHDAIMQGSTLRFRMGKVPNPLWGARLQAQKIPVPVTTVPFVLNGKRTFRDSLEISLACNTPGAEIYYTTDGSAPTMESPSAHSAVTLRHTTSLQAFAVKAGTAPSPVVRAEFLRTSPIGSIILKSGFAQQYSGGGVDALVDGLRGGRDFRLGGWQGYEGVDLDAILDLDSSRTLHEVSLGCLQDNNSWIFFPTEVDFSFSNDDSTWNSPKKIMNDVSPQDPNILIKNFMTSTDSVRARFVRVQARNVGTCPPWHKGSGGKAWLFVDEVIVK